MPPPNPTSIPRDSFPEPVARYLADLVSTLTQGGFPLANVAVFGSAARSDFAQDVSDVDLIVVLSDDVSVQDRRRVQEEVSRLEVVHGLRPPVSRTKGVLERFIDRAGGNALSSFVCSRSELLAGDMAKVLGLSRTEALFADRIAFAANCHLGRDRLGRRPCAGRTGSSHSPIRRPKGVLRLPGSTPADWRSLSRDPRGNQARNGNAQAFVA